MKRKRWQFINKSVQGASHVRKNTPCQDYSLCSVGEDGSPPLILAVSDGHGGSKYVRSAQGAVFACEAAVEVAGAYGAGVFLRADANIIKQISEARLKTDIIKLWQEKVLAHAESRPFTEDELEALGATAESIEGELGAKEAAEKETILAAYGATLLLVIVLKEVIICQQIGDGDILFYYKGRNRGVINPIGRDSQLLGNETTSLCSPKAPFYMRHSVTYLYDKANVPDLIILATDGYANSFTGKEDFYKIAKDYYGFLSSASADKGAGFVEANIEEWLAETSREGSGDDITVVTAWRSHTEGV